MMSSNLSIAVVLMTFDGPLHEVMNSLSSNCVAPLNVLKLNENCFSFQILRDAQRLAERMYHRGACACDNDTGDGAGVMTAIPHQLYAKEL